MLKKLMSLLLAAAALFSLAVPALADGGQDLAPVAVEEPAESPAPNAAEEAPAESLEPDAAEEAPAESLEPDIAEEPGAGQPGLPPEGAAGNGWHAFGGKWYYYLNGSPVVNDWVVDAGRRYHLNSLGETDAGLRQIDGVTYYLNERHDGYYGAVVLGWKQLGGAWYYFDPLANGAMVVNAWRMDGNGMCYLGADGRMATGFVEVDGKTYYLLPSGKKVGTRAAGWQKISGDWYYFEADGTMAVNAWQRDSNGMCYLGADGRMVTGFLEVDGKTYYLRESGAKVGTRATGWQSLNGAWYCFDGDGAMITSDWAIDTNGMCYLGADGRLLSGWQTIDGVTYYLNERHNGSFGVRSVRPTYIDGKMYMFGANGALITNTQVGLLGKTWNVDGNGVIEGYLTATSAQAAAVLDRVGWTLRSAFNWSVGLTYYNRALRAPSGSIHSDFYANYGFQNRRGNCYVMACTFYQMARLLGYEVYFVEGHVANSRGGKGADHGWTEIVQDGKLYVYDPNFTNEMGLNGFKIQYGQRMTWRYQYYQRIE